MTNKRKNHPFQGGCVTYHDPTTPFNSRVRFKFVLQSQRLVYKRCFHKESIVIDNTNVSRIQLPANRIYHEFWKGYYANIRPPGSPAE